MSQEASTEQEVLGPASRRTGRPRRDTPVSKSTQEKSRTHEKRSLSVDQLRGTRDASHVLNLDVSQNDSQRDDAEEEEDVPEANNTDGVAEANSQSARKRGRPTVRLLRVDSDVHDAAGSQLSRQLTFDDSQGATRGSRAGGLRASRPMYPQQLRQHSVADPTNISHPGSRPSSLVRHRSTAADASKQPATQLMDTLQWKNRGGGVADPKERSHTRCGPVLHNGTRSGVGTGRDMSGVSNSRGTSTVEMGRGNSEEDTSRGDSLDDSRGNDEKSAIEERVDELLCVAAALKENSKEWLMVIDRIDELCKKSSVAESRGKGDDYDDEDEVLLVAEEPVEKHSRGAMPKPTMKGRNVLVTATQLLKGSRKNNESRPVMKDSEQSREGNFPPVAMRRSSDRDADVGRNVQRPGSETRTKIKLSEYDGTTPWPIFCGLFESCSEFNRWDEAERTIHLQVALRGAAQQVLWTDGRVRWKSEDLLTELSKRFSPESQIDQYRAALFARRRRRGETIENLGQDIARLAALAFPGPKDQTKEMLAIDAFIRAIDNADMGFHMKRTASVKTLADAVCYGQQYEAAYACRGDEDSMYVEPRKEKKDRIKVAAARDDKDSRPRSNDDIEKKMSQFMDMMKLEREQLQSQKKEFEQAMLAVAASSKPPLPHKDGNNYRGRGSFRGGNRGSRRDGDRSKAKDDRLCYNCNKPGHMARDCWSRKSQNDDRSNKESQPDENTNAENTLKTASLRYWMQPVMLEVKLNGVPRLCLVDTGSATTLVPPDCVEGLRLMDTTKRCQQC